MAASNFHLLLDPIIIDIGFRYRNKIDKPLELRTIVQYIIELDDFSFILTYVQGNTTRENFWRIFSETSHQQHQQHQQQNIENINEFFQLLSKFSEFKPLIRKIKIKNILN